MARLTRTQKYADLRNQLENGREVEIQNENISKVEEDKHEELIQPVVEEPVQPVEVIEPAKVEEIKEVKPEPVVEDDGFETISFDDLFEPSVESESDFEPITLAKEPVVEEVKVEEPVAKEPVTEPVIEKPIVIDTIVEPITVNNPEPVVEEPEVDDLTNNYLEECLNEVNEYNKSKGLMTDDEIPTTILNEIRGTLTEPKPVAAPVEELKVEDEDFTNTVTLEIKKILSELDSSDVEALDEPEPVVEEKLVQTQVDPAEQTMTNDEVTDILKSYLNEDDGDTDLAKTMTVGKIEDVPAAENTLAEETTIDATLLSEQIPLEVVKETSEIPAANTEEDEDDEEETEGPNRILNFVLIALIVVLLLILGFIGYMILVAQGII